jgi:DNA invertase Pin-like site-specific DNA recombinase
MVEALSYLRTSSLANIGDEHDSEDRQRAAIARYAERNGIRIVAEYRDPGVTGTDPIDGRPGFSAMLRHIASNGVRMILVENASRFARDLLVQELGHALLRRLDVQLVPVDDPDAFSETSATGVMIRQLLGAVSQFEKTNLVAKLRSGREAKRRRDGRCGGIPCGPPEAVIMAGRLRDEGLSLRGIADRLFDAGYRSRANRGGLPRAYSPQSVKGLLARS